MELLKSDCIAAALIIDFWISRVKYRYISIICFWVSIDWQPKEAQQVSYSHIGKVIAKLLIEIFIKWNINKKIISLITDNTSNI